MILTGSAIVEAVEAGRIVIDPFDLDQVGPNSYDFRLGDRCRMYCNSTLDAAIDNPTSELEIGENGILLDPARIYLFNTVEVMGSTHYVPIIRGRSSTGRLGIFIDITADLIDIGSINQWTLQLHAVQPIRVYPGMLVGQVTFWCVHGEIVLYSGKYEGVSSPASSLSFLDPRFK